MATVLCIDDDERALSIRSKILEQMHYRVLSANSAQDGLALCSRETADLILLDYFLPDMTGAQVAWELRRRGSDVPVLMLSSAMFCPHEARDLIDGFCAKIDGPIQLLNRIAELVQLAEQRRDMPHRSRRHGNRQGCAAAHTFRRAGFQVLKAASAASSTDAVLRPLSQ